MAPLRTTPAKGRNLTAELVARVERFEPEPDPGPEPGTTEHTEAEFDAMVEALLFEYKPQELWVFAYGSLIWNPQFDFLESRSPMKRLPMYWLAQPGTGARRPNICSGR